MPCRPRFNVLLISRAPEMHEDVIRSLHRRGDRVATARRASDALALLRRRPEVVLVDLVMGACLTTPLVRALNRAGRSSVFALHGGSLEAIEETALGLSVQGFCRPGDLEFGALPSSGATTSASPTVH